MNMREINPGPDNNFKIYIYLSLFIHIILFIIAYFGLPSFNLWKPKDEQVITFEMVPLSSISNIQTKDTAKKERDEKDAQTIKETKKQSTPESNADKEKEDDSKAKADEEKLKIEDKKKEVVKKEPTKKEQEKSVKPSSKKKQPKAKDAKANKDPMEAILKTIEEASDGKKVKSQNRSKAKNDTKNSKYSKGMNYDEDSPLSLTEKLYIKNLIQKNWHPPVGLDILKDIKVLINIQLNKNGEIIDIQTLDVICPTGMSEACGLYEESALRAIKLSSPVENLHPERYEQWKEFKLFFDLESFN